MTSRMKQSQTSALASTSVRKGQQKSLEEQVYEMQIQNIEAERLRKTFIRMCGGPKEVEKNQSEKNQAKEKFDKKDVIKILTELDFPFSKPEVDQWIWEVDEDLDGAVNEYEFTLMYKRCIFDKTGLEPRNLFNLVQFLMYDLGCRGKITVEDTLELIYVRYPNELQDHIDYIFEGRETIDEQERFISFEEYLQQMRKRDLKRRKDLEAERKTVTNVKLKKDE